MPTQCTVLSKPTTKATGRLMSTWAGGGGRHWRPGGAEGNKA
jgi:hypothetical protein